MSKLAFIRDPGNFGMFLDYGLNATPWLPKGIQSRLKRRVTFLLRSSKVWLNDIE